VFLSGRLYLAQWTPEGTKNNFQRFYFLKKVARNQTLDDNKNHSDLSELDSI
jgi:hypothetical protein